MKNNIFYSLIETLYSKYTLIFMILYATLVIILQNQYLHASPQTEEQKDVSYTNTINTAIDVDVSNNLGKRETELFSALQESQIISISEKKYTSETYIQKYGNTYKEKILVLYPAVRSTLYMAYPDIPNNSLIETYIQNFEISFRKEAKEATQDFYDFLGDDFQCGFTFALKHYLLFEVPFYSKELRIIKFSITKATHGNSGYTIATVFFILKDGTELVYDDIFTDYTKALTLIAKTAKADLMQRFIEADISSEEWIQKGTLANTENYNKNIAFNQSGDISVYYPKYQVAAGGYGNVTVIIPYSTIAPLLSNTMKKLLQKN